MRRRRGQNMRWDQTDLVLRSGGRRQHRCRDTSGNVAPR